MTKKIILDCDPGHDDAVAILLALGNPEIELLGVTTVGGNQSLEKVTYNARAVLEKAHATDVAVYAGCDRPIVRPQEVAASIHGESGLDGVELPVPTRPLEQKLGGAAPSPWFPPARSPISRWPCAWSRASLSA